MTRRDLFVAQIGIAALVALGLVLLVMRPAFAYTCDTTSCTFSAKYTESATVSTGSPLTNLISCTINYSISTNGAPAVARPAVVVPASSPTGGQVMTKPITDTTLLPGFNYSVNAAVACTNPAGTGASFAAPTPLPISRAGEVPPNVPPGLILQ